MTEVVVGEKASWSQILDRVKLENGGMSNAWHHAWTTSQVLKDCGFFFC